MKLRKIALICLFTLSCNLAIASESTSSKLSGSHVTDNTSTEGVTSVSEEALFKKLIHTESRGYQFGRDGSPLTSPKGAIGAAQVMPNTAPEAARLAGLEWNSWKYRNDREYNKALGKAYFSSQLFKYNGNHVLALAAYNAGPGSVDKWLKRFGDPRTGEISNKQFIKLIPFLETQNYVASILDKTLFNSSEILKSSIRTKGSEHQFEFRDTHPGFRFTLSVEQKFVSGNGKLVGGL